MTSDGKMITFKTNPIYPPLRHDIKSVDTSSTKVQFHMNLNPVCSTTQNVLDAISILHRRCLESNFIKSAVDFEVYKFLKKGLIYWFGTSHGCTSEMLGVSLKNTQQYGVIEKINLHNSFLLQNWHYVGANNWKYIETGFVRLPDIKAILMAYYIPLDEMERINVIGFVLDGNCIPNEPTTHILAFNQGSRRTTTYRQDVRVVKKLQDVEAIETKKLNDTRNRSIMYWFGNGGIPGSFFTHVDKSKIINFVEKSVSKGSKIGNETKTKKFCKFNNGTPVKVSDASSTSRNHRKVKLRSANKRSIPTKSSIMNNTVSIGSKMTTPAVKLDAGEVVVEEKVADGRKPTEGNNNKGGVDRNVSYKGAKNEERNNKKADRNDSRKGKSGAIEVGKNEHLVSKTNNRKKASNKTYFAVPTTPSTPITIAPTLPPRPPSSSKKEPLFVNTSLLKKDILIWVNLSTKLNQTI